MLKKLTSKVISSLPILLFAFLGGFCAQIALHTFPSEAAAKMLSYLKVYDATNSKGIEFYVHQGYPAQNYYAPDGKIRIQNGIYNGAGEQGLPLVSLNDNQGNIRMLLRLAGRNESPVLIFKDTQHRDRLVLGLGLNADQNPFLAVFDENGAKTNVFGSY